MNIFANAYFSKPYKTRDGRKAIYFINNQCIVEGELAIHSYCSNGDYTVYGTECSLDIVSEWQEPINEEEIDRLAEEFCDKEYENPTDVNKSQNGLELGYTNLLNCFKAGYRKANETQI